MTTTTTAGAAVDSASDNSIKAGAGRGGLIYSVPMGTQAGLDWLLLVFPARRVAAGYDLARRVILSTAWDCAAVGDDSNERAAAWARVRGLLKRIDDKRQAAAARRRAGFPLPVKRAVAGGDGRGGAWVGRKGGKVKRVSTRGGVGVRSNERARVLADGAARFAAMGAAGVACVCAAGADMLRRGWASVPLAAALASGYAAAGPLLREAQGQLDLSMCAAMAAKLIRIMRRDGKRPSSTTADDACGAALLALARWRSINGRHPGRRVRGTAASVAWAAVVRESSRDLLGDAIGLGDGAAADSLCASAVPLPQFAGDDSRQDKAARLAYERARGQRAGKLAARLAMLPAAGRRGEAVAKLGHAAALLLGGVGIDSAAASAGFKSSGRGRGAVRAGDRLAQAARRLGFPFQFNLRQGAASLVGVRELVQVVSPLGFRVWSQVERREVADVSTLAAEWAARAAACPLHRGKVSGREVKRQHKAAAVKRHNAERKAKRQSWAAARRRDDLTARRLARRARASAKLRGELFGAFVPSVEMMSGAEHTRARLLAAWRGKVWGAV